MVTPPPDAKGGPPAGGTSSQAAAAPCAAGTDGAAPPRGGTLARLLGPARARLAGEVLRFGAVGTLGFVVDAGVLTAAIALGAGPWLGRLASYLAAATTTFALNRAWTFRARAAAGAAPVARQWGLFLAVNLVGFAANYGAYAALVAAVPLAAAHPVLGVAAGSLAGLAANFALSRRYVFAAVPP